MLCLYLYVRVSIHIVNITQNRIYISTFCIYNGIQTIECLISYNVSLCYIIMYCILGDRELNKLPVDMWNIILIQDFVQL